MAKKRTSSSTIKNRRARYDYQLGDDLLVGVQLTGPETKALRLGFGHLKGAYVTVKETPKSGELWLINATISGGGKLPISDTEQTRSRKLLAKRKEIETLIAAKQQGLAIVPLELLTKTRYIKLRIAAGRGQKKYDKRAALKEREAKRSVREISR